MTRYGMVIDLDRCNGCRACMEACKVENATPRGSYWMYVFRFEQGKYPNTKINFLPRPCQHCENAPCVKVCPVGARYTREDGLVATDADRCIGCRYCEVACPYGVNSFNWKEPSESYYLDWDDPAVKKVTNGVVPPYRNPDLDRLYGPERRLIAGGGHHKGVVDKCTFCVQRVEDDRNPACVQTCPMEVIHFGDLEDPESVVSQLVRSRPNFRLLEDSGTDPGVYYLGGQEPGERSHQIEAPEAEVG